MAHDAILGRFRTANAIADGADGAEPHAVSRTKFAVHRKFYGLEIEPHITVLTRVAC
jgi:hypothetical protein